MAGLLSTAVSGLRVFQQSIEVTSHNIANVGTEGFSRQRVESGTNPAEFTGAGYVGTGVHASNITRSYDQFISTQLRSSTTTLGEATNFRDYASQVDNLLADPSTGLDPAIQGFFDSVHDVASDPSSLVARDVMLLEANGLTARFSVMNQRFDELREQVNSNVRSMVDVVNSITASIADLNVRISESSAKASGGQLPNDLLDERDVILNDLAELMDISVIPQDSGMVAVIVKNGLPLVSDAFASKLAVQRSEFDGSRLDITLQTFSGPAQVITNQITSGKIAGTLRFRDEILDPAQQQLGSVAAGIAMEFNALHKVSVDASGVPIESNYDENGNLGGTGGYDINGNPIGGGYDIDGNAGDAFFTFKGDEISTIASTFNAGNAKVTAKYSDINLQPAMIDDGSGNLISNPESSSSADIDMSDYMLNYDGTDYSLQRIDDGTSFALDRVGGTLTPAYPEIDKLPGITLEISGVPDGKGQFLIRPTYNAASRIEVNITEGRKIAAAKNFNSDTGDIINGAMPGDNSNALKLSRLATNTDMFEGTLSYQDVYGGLVSNVGGKTHIAKISAAAQDTLWTAANGARESLGGVNLDEEAANLIRFQQSYQAAAQAISTASSMFDTLMGAVR